jgi:hypothetical protein
VTGTAAGCSSFRQAPRPAAGGAPPGAAVAELPAWQVPPEAYGSQTLYRVAIAGAEGEASLKLALRLAAPARYQAEAVDALGRAVWGLDVDDDHGLWLDHRGRSYCRLAGALDLAFLPLGPLSLSALPPLLLGRVPIGPADPAGLVAGAAAAGGGNVFSYGDAAGRRWGATVRHGVVLAWALWQDDAAGPILSWVSSGGWAVLSDRRRGVQVRWRETLREPLRKLAPMAAPADYREASCVSPAAPMSLPPQ